jgi:hypothetical protein
MLKGTITRSPRFTVCTRRTHIFNDTDEFVAEGVTDSGVGHQPVVEVQSDPQIAAS